MADENIKVDSGNEGQSHEGGSREKGNRNRNRRHRNHKPRQNNDASIKEEVVVVETTGQGQTEKPSKKGDNQPGNQNPNPNKKKKHKNNHKRPIKTDKENREADGEETVVIETGAPENSKKQEAQGQKPQGNQQKKKKKHKKKNNNSQGFEVVRIETDVDDSEEVVTITINDHPINPSVPREPREIYLLDENNQQVETSIGVIEIIKDDLKCFNVSDFEKKYCEILGKYEFLVGDYLQELLRLKGFTRKNAKRIPDYINEYCSLDEKYFIVRNPNYDEMLVVSEE